MKRFLIFLLIFLLQLPCAFSETLNGEVSFDWISKTQMERDENIEYIRERIFSNDVVIKYDKKTFKESYRDKIKDKSHINNYNEIAQGKTEDRDKYYCGFFWKKYLMAYGIQYKDKYDENLYYDAMGNLKWVDRYSVEYPNFPYISYQYNIKGELRAVYYFNSKYDQYIYDETGKFKGRWYKDKMYDRKAKVILTRSYWD